MEKPVKPLPQDFGLSDEEVETLYEEVDKTKDITLLTYFKYPFIILIFSIFVFYLYTNPEKIHEDILGFVFSFINLSLGCTFILFVIFIFINDGFEDDYFRNKKINSILNKNISFQKYFLIREIFLKENEIYVEYQRKLSKEFWTNLSGHKFEEEVHNLFLRKGFKSTLTKGSGDKGIDLIIEENNENTIIQCKNHKKPVGPSVVRELYGVMISEGSTKGLLICTGGFTKGVYEFVSDKSISLWDINSIIDFSK